MKRSPDVVYIDTYKLFSTQDGTYSRQIVDENGKAITVRLSRRHPLHDRGRRLSRPGGVRADRRPLAAPEAGRPEGSDRLELLRRKRRGRAGLFVDPPLALPAVAEPVLGHDRTVGVEHDRRTAADDATHPGADDGRVDGTAADHATHFRRTGHHGARPPRRRRSRSRRRSDRARACDRRHDRSVSCAHEHRPGTRGRRRGRHGGDRRRCRGIQPRPREPRRRQAVGTQARPRTR